ncbi:MAG: hypothetical protein ACT4NY_22615 [Pseudonocardiales bacterium]
MRKLKLVAAAGAGLMALTLAAGPALADPTGPTPPPYRELVGVGSETTESVMNDLSNAIVIGGIKPIGSYDAVPVAGVVNITTKDPATNPACQNLTRPSGSTNGVTRLVADRTAGTGCFQFARSSSNNSSSFAGTGLTWIPFARDTLSYIYRADGATSLTFTQATLTAIYNCSGPAGPGVPASLRIRPVLPQFGSGTRRDFLSRLGFTDAANFVTQPNHTCIRDVSSDGTTVIENQGRELENRNEVAPHSISLWKVQESGTKPNFMGLARIGNLNGVPFLSPNQPWQRDVYNVVPSEFLGTAPYSTVFVDTDPSPAVNTSLICQNATIIEQTNGFTPIANCGETVINTN